MILWGQFKSLNGVEHIVSRIGIRMIRRETQVQLTEDVTGNAVSIVGQGWVNGRPTFIFDKEWVSLLTFHLKRGLVSDAGGERQAKSLIVYGVRPLVDRAQA